jgi:hypothetical protein
MRCPKCGFISFDHLTTCLNCSKDISEVSSAAHGTTYNATPPMFLNFTKNDGPKNNAVNLKAESDSLAGDLDLVDPDLDILINDEEEEGIEFNSDDLDTSLKDEFGGSDKGFDTALDEEEPDEMSDDSELAVDLSQFEDMTPGAGSSEATAEKFTMNLPDELADISDLAPPAPPQKQRSATQENRSLDDGMDFDTLDMDLKLDGMDAGFSLTSPIGREEGIGIGSLSLDDIDLSSPLEKEKSAPPAPKAAPKPAHSGNSGEMDMDADLNFELDLGGLTIPEK